MAIPESIKKLANDIRTKVYGREVRESLAKGIEAAGETAEDARIKSEDTEIRQTVLEKQFDDEIANMTLADPSSAEIVAARTNANTGESYDTIGRRLDAEHANVTTQLADINKQVDNNGGLVDSNAILLENMHFNLTKVITKADNKMKIVDLDLGLLNASTKMIENVYQIDGNLQVNYHNDGIFVEWVNKDSEVIFKTCFPVRYPSIEISADFTGEPDSSGRLGICKDVNNWILANYDTYSGKIIELIWKINGVFNSVRYTSTASLLTSNNFKIEMLINNNVITITVYDNDNKNVSYSYETDISSYIDLTLVDLSQWKVAMGARISGSHNRPIKLKSLSASFGYGKSIGGDFRVVTYEDGSPIKEGNSIFITSTNHSTELIKGHGGVNVFRLDMNVFELTLVGRIFQKENGRTVGAATPKVLYDRDTGYWYYSATDFSIANHYISVGKTKADLRYGVQVVETQKASLVGETGTLQWEFDFIKQNGKYTVIYLSNGYMQMGLADDITGTITLQKKATVARPDGTAICKVGGKLRITIGKPDYTGLEIYDIALNKVGEMQFDYYMGEPSKPPVAWGSVLPVQKRDLTEYYFLLYDLMNWKSRKYSYGNLCIYKAREANKQEYESRNIINF